MKLNYNVIGKERKRMVAVIGELTEIKPIYTRMPECAYVIGEIKVSKTGELIAEDAELANRITSALGEAGFTAEESTSTSSPDTLSAKSWRLNSLKMLTIGLLLN